MDRWLSNRLLALRGFKLVLSAGASVWRKHSNYNCANRLCSSIKLFSFYSNYFNRLRTNSLSRRLHSSDFLHELVECKYAVNRKTSSPLAQWHLRHTHTRTRNQPSFPFNYRFLLQMRKVVDFFNLIDLIPFCLPYFTYSYAFTYIYWKWRDTTYITYNFTLTLDCFVFFFNTDTKINFGQMTKKIILK